MAHQTSTLAWKIPWTEEPSGLQSMGSWRVGHDWATSLSLFTFLHWRRKWQPTPVFLPRENPRDGGAWWAAVHAVAQSRTWLKRLSSSSSSSTEFIVSCMCWWYIQRVDTSASNLQRWTKKFFQKLINVLSMLLWFWHSIKNTVEY